MYKFWCWFFGHKFAIYPKDRMFCSKCGEARDISLLSVTGGPVGEERTFRDAIQQAIENFPKNYVP